MPGFVRKILIFITGYAWLALLAGPGLIGLSFYSSWKADGDHAYAARESLQSVSGTVTGASEVTVKRKRRATKQYYEINVQPEGAGADHLKALARIARLLRDQDVAKKLRASRDAPAIYSVLALPPATAA